MKRRWKFVLFEEEEEGNTLVSSLSDGFSIGHQSGIFHLLAFVINHVQQAEIEPHFGAELEVGQIAVAP